MTYAFSDGSLIDRSHSGLISGEVGAALEETWLSKGAEKLRSIARTQFQIFLQELRTRPDNWDGRGSLAANASSLFEASVLFDTALEETGGLHFDWVAPHVSLDESGHVVLEWWNRRKKLTVYAAPGNPEFVCSWGPNIEQQMHSDSLVPGSFTRSWRWLWTAQD